MEFLKKKVNLEMIFIIMIVAFKYFQFYNFIPSIIMLGYMAIMMFLFIYIFSYKKFSKMTFLKILLMFLISLYCFLLNRDDGLLLFVMASVVMMDRDNDKFIKYFFYSSLVLFCLTILLNYIGLLPSYDINKYVDDIALRRYSLGFGHVNSVFLYYLPILFGSYYLCGFNKKKYLKVVGIQFIITYILYRCTLCRTGYLISLLFLIYSVFERGKLINIFRKCVKYCFPVFTIISLLIAIFYGSNKFSTVNLLLSNRATLIYHYIKNGEIFSLFGTVSELTYTLDNLYAFILVKYGFIIFIVYCLLHYFSTKKLENNDRYLIFILFFLIYGISEGNISTNFMLVIQLKSLFVDKNRGDLK